MKEFIQDNVSKRFAQLPRGVQDVILSDDLAITFGGIMKQADLTQEKMKICNEQATLVLVGLSTTKEFKTFVTEELGIPLENAVTLFNAISSHIFIPVRDELLKAFDQKKTHPENTPSQNDPYREQIV